MRGDNYVLAVTTTKDDISGEVIPLFSLPVQICKATDDSDLRFDIAAPSGAPRQQVYKDSSTGDLVEDNQCMHGIRVGDTFQPIPEDQIAKINEATKITTMIALGSVDLADVPFDRQTGIYYLQSPVKGGVPKAYKLLYEGLRGIEKGRGKRPAKAIVTKRTPRSRQTLCVIYADVQRECLVMSELRFHNQLKKPDEMILAPQQAEVAPGQVEKVRTVIENLGDGLLAIETEVDEAVAMKRELIEQALAGQALEVPKPIGAGIAMGDLEDLLEASIAAVGAAK